MDDDDKSGFVKFGSRILAGVIAICVFSLTLFLVEKCSSDPRARSKKINTRDSDHPIVLYHNTIWWGKTPLPRESPHGRIDDYSTDAPVHFSAVRDLINCRVVAIGPDGAGDGDVGYYIGAIHGESGKMVYVHVKQVQP